MLITELIEKLSKFMKTHGDLPVFVLEDEAEEVSCVELSGTEIDGALPYSTEKACFLVSQSHMDWLRELKTGLEGKMRIKT